MSNVLKYGVMQEVAYMSKGMSNRGDKTYRLVIFKREIPTIKANYPLIRFTLTWCSRKPYFVTSLIL